MKLQGELDTFYHSLAFLRYPTNWSMMTSTASTEDPQSVLMTQVIVMFIIIPVFFYCGLIAYANAKATRLMLAYTRTHVPVLAAHSDTPRDEWA